MDNIDEMIAKAMEEEERTVIENYPIPKEISQYVNIELSEYVELRQMQRDYSLLLQAIFNDLRLSYGGDRLMLHSDDNLMQTVEVLFPASCQSKFDSLKEEEKKED